MGKQVLSNKSRNLASYMGGRFISLIGTGIQMIALPLYILDMTHSGTMMGIFSMLNLIPNIITAPFAGILGDRKNRKTIMVIVDYGRGALVFMLGVLAATGSLNLYSLFITQIFISIMDSIFNASSGALLPELITEEELMKAMSLRGGLDATSMILGPVLGGMIYGLFGIKAVFFINAFSFIVSGISAMLIIYKRKIINNGNIKFQTFISDNKEILSFIKNNKGLKQLFVFAMITNFLISPCLEIVMPYSIKQGIGFSSQDYGYLMGIFTLGLLLGNVILGTRFNKFSTEINMKAGFIFETIALVQMSICMFPKIVTASGGHTLKLFCILAMGTICAGFFNAFVNTPLNTNLQKMVPNEMRSRFFSILGLVFQAAVPLGSIIYGMLLDKFPYYDIVFLITVLNGIATFIFIIVAAPEVYEPRVESENC